MQGMRISGLAFDALSPSLRPVTRLLIAIRIRRLAIISFLVPTSFRQTITIYQTQYRRIIRPDLIPAATGALL